jgi:putative flavoprotein involved in K+ transport
MMASDQPDIVVIGAGQAGLAVGYYLKRHGLSFVVLEAGSGIGHTWRSRWDSLRLFTPASFALPGLRLPLHARTYPSKEQIADYLESYAERFEIPVRLGAHVDQLTRDGDRYLVHVGDQGLAVAHVIVATGPYMTPYIPPFAAALRPDIVQLHSAGYRNPKQLQDGTVLVVGAGNSGAEIALETSAAHDTVLAGRDTGRLPITLGPLGYRLLRRLPANRPPGSRMAKRLAHRGAPLVRVHPRHLQRAGVRRVDRVTGTVDGWPQLADGTVLPTANVLWCTGFLPDYHWIKLPTFAGNGWPRHDRGIVHGEPGLYMVGLPFQSSLASHLIGGVGADAAHVVDALAQQRHGNTEPASHP